MLCAGQVENQVPQNYDLKIDIQSGKPPTPSYTKHKT